MRPTLFRIGSLPVRGYGLMVAIAFLVAIYLAAHRAKKEGIPSQTIFDLGLYLLVSALLGARIFHYFQHRDSYQSFTDVFKVWQGGLAYYGGFLLALTVGVLYLRSRKLSIAKVTDIFAPSLVLGLGIGRIGCFLAGCCFGKPTSLPWGVTFPRESLVWMEIGSQKVHPTQLYSSLSLICIFVVLLILRRHIKLPGQLFLSAVLMYALHRFFIDFLRHYTSDERIGSLATSQVMSVLAGTIAVAAMIALAVRRASRTAPTGRSSPGEGERPR